MGKENVPNRAWVGESRKYRDRLIAQTGPGAVPCVVYIFRRADRDELLDLNSPYHRFLVGFENGFSQARSGATHWRIQGKAFGANVFPHIGSARNRFSRIKENFTTFLRKCWLITLHSSAQGIEIRVFFLINSEKPFWGKPPQCPRPLPGSASCG